LKKWLLVVANVVLCLALVAGVACGGGGDGKEEGVKEVKLGIGAPLGGIYAKFVGIPSKQGFELAADYIGEFTVDGQRYKWNLIFEDSGIDSAGGMASATKLIFEDGVKLMSQVYGTPALAAQTTCEESDVILLTTGIPLDALGPDKPHTFLGMTCGEVSSSTLMKYISEERPEVKTAAAISEDTTTGQVLAETLATAAEHFGIEWIGTEWFDPAATEFYPVATKMADKDPDLCYAESRQIGPMREMGWEGTSFYGVWYPYFGESAGWGNIEGHLSYYPEPLGEELPELAKEIAAEYQQRYGEQLAMLPFTFIIQLYYLTDALQKAGTVDDVDQIIAALESENLDTPVGMVKFGLEELDGIGHMVIMPSWIGEIRGINEYHQVFYLTTDEAETLTLEVFGQ
jgi:ABC-type branched-subunit amino acid transport system substrate-binding protein